MQRVKVIFVLVYAVFEEKGKEELYLLHAQF